VAPELEDDGFHEIQLNGKQLVFLFMAATVVSVVIFLCGVLVGRGVRVERGSVADSGAATVAETTPQQPQPATPPVPAGSDPTAAAPPPTPTTDDLSYFKRLEKPQPPSDELKRKPAPATPAPAKSPAASAPAAGSAAAASSASAPVSAKAPASVQSPASGKTPGSAQAPASSNALASAQTPASVKAPASAQSPASAPATAPAAVKEPPAGTTEAQDASGFVVQIAALNVRSEAEAIAKRLSSKGYAAYVLTPAHGTPSVFRVRVGKFNTRREAETIAAKLQKEEQLKPWVTR
jgi:cell division septation protein DedD